MRQIASDGLKLIPPNTTMVPLGNWNQPYWTLPFASTGVSALQVTTDGLLAWSGSTNLWPIALYDRGGGQTWDPDQWVQVTVGPWSGTVYGMAAVLRASSSGLMMMSIIPSSSSAVSLNYMAANYGVNWSPASSNYLMAPGSGLNVFTGPLSVGDIFRMRVVGNPGVVTVERSTGGGPFASVSSLGNGNVVRTEAQGIISGSPGVSGMRASNAHYIYDFVAGDFQPSVLPPTPPTGPQGAFTLRTT